MAYSWKNPELGYCQGINFIIGAYWLPRWSLYSLALLHIFVALIVTFVSHAPALHAGLVLLFVEEHESFWLLHSIIDTIAPDYFTIHMSGVEADMRLLRELLRRHAPKAAERMESVGADITLNCFKWLPSLGVGCFPSEVRCCLFVRGMQYRSLCV